MKLANAITQTNRRWGYSFIAWLDAAIGSSVKNFSVMSGGFF